MKIRVFPGLIHIFNVKQWTNPTAVWLLHQAIGIEQGGRDVILYDDLLEMGLEIWKPSKFYYIYKKTLELGLIREYSYIENNKTIKKVARIGRKSFCEKLGIELGNYFVEMDSKFLSTIGEFRAFIYTTFITGETNGIISRETIKKITNVSVSTQKRYENSVKKNGVEIEKKRNALITHFPETNLEIAKEVLHPNCYIQDGKIIRPLPNSYKTDIKITGRKTAKKINKRIISKKSNVFKIRQDATDHSRKLFFDSEASAKNYMLKYDTARTLLYPYEDRNEYEKRRCSNITYWKIY